MSAASRASDAKGVIHLNISWYAWENARRAFHKEIENPGQDFNSPSQCPIEPPTHDAFAGHLLFVHHLQCRECTVNNGGDAPILPDSDKRTRALCAETGTQTEPEPEAEAEPEPGTRTEPEPEAEAEPGTRTEPEAEAGTGTQSQTEPEQEDLRMDSQLKVPYHNTVDAETQTEQEDENLSVTGTSVAPGPGAVPDSDSVSGSVIEASNPDSTEPDAEVLSHLETGSAENKTSGTTDINQASTLSSGSPLTRNWNVIPRGPDGKFCKVGRRKRYLKRREYERKREEERKKRREEQDILNDSPRVKRKKRSVPKESAPIIEPRKSHRIQQRMEAQAKSLHDMIFTMPVPTKRDDEDDGWIEDDPSAESLKESKPGKCMSYRSASSLIKEEVADNQPITNFTSTSDFIPTNSRDADNRPFTYSEGSSGINPNNSIDTGYPPVPSSNRTPDLEASITSDAGGSLATHCNSSPWSHHLSPITIPEFSGPPPGPTSKLSPYHQDITYFHLLFPPHLIHHLVVETNYCAERCQAAGGNLEQWKPTTVYEMQAFLGLQMLMSTSFLPDLSLYWSRECSLLRINAWEVMSQDRFMAILQYCQPCDCSSHSEKGGESHVRDSCKVLDIINDCCRLQYAPHRDCTVYEAIIKLANEQEICLCLRVDSENGYCNEFQVCPAEKGVRDKHGLRDSIVLDLTHRLQKQHYIVNLSESFTNLELLRTLKEKGILGRCAVNNTPRNLVSLPSQLFSKSIHHNMVFQQGNITACSWYNTISRRQVISSADDPKCTYQVQQKYKGKLIISQCPKAVVHHMKSMHANPFRNPYPTQGRSSTRESCIFWFAFDVAVANALILKHGSGCTQKAMMSFRNALAVQLIKNYRQQEETHRPYVLSGIGVQSNPQHSVCTNDSVLPVSLSYDHDKPSHAMYSSSTDVDIQISRVTGGLGMQSYMHSDGANDIVQPAGPTYRPDMQSNILHSCLTNDNVQQTRPTDDLTVQSLPLHSDSTSDHVHPSGPSNCPGLQLNFLQSNILHSCLTNDNVQQTRPTDDLTVQSLPLHSDSTSDHVHPSGPTNCPGMQLNFLHSNGTSDNFLPSISTDGLGIQSQTLHSHNTDVKIRISRVTSGLGVPSSSLLSDGTSDNVQPAVPVDGIGMHSDLGGSPVQPTNLATSYEHISKKIKVEPYD